MKKYIALLVCLALAFSLCACSRAPESDDDALARIEAETAKLQAEADRLRAETEKINAEKEAATPQPAAPAGDAAPTNEAAAIDDYVSVLREEHLVYNDGSNDWDATFTLPLISEYSDDTRAANAELQRRLLPNLEEAINARDEGYSLICTGIDYTAFLTGDCFTLVATIGSDWGCDEYLVYTFNCATGAALTREDYATLAGCSTDELREAIRTTLERAFEDNTAQLPEDMRDDFYLGQQTANRSDTNVDACTLCLAEDGSIYVHGRVYSMAGAESYEYVLPLVAD